MNKMTMRERMLAVIQGKELDRVPFVQYDNFIAPNEEIWSAVGRNSMGVLRWSGIHRVEHPNCRFVSEEIEKTGLKGRRTTMYTPKGQLTEESFFEPTFGSASISKHYIQEPEDYEIFLAFLRDITVHESLDCYLKDLREVGEDGLPMVSVDRTPYQQMWVQWVSLLDLCLHMADFPDIVEECISLLTGMQRKVFEIIRKAADKVTIPFVDFPDNITAPVIGEQYFKRYCVPLYNELADLLSDKNILVSVHMDGDLKPLWKDIGESKVRGLDSFSPLPDNDTSAAQAVSMWPEMRLFMNYPSSIHLATPEEIYRMTMQILEEAGHTGRLWIQVSENVPPGMWSKSFPQIIKAIGDFGKP